jgi:ribonuclease HII
MRLSRHAPRGARHALTRPALVDGNRLPQLGRVGAAGLTARAIVGGDATEPAISAASILAKTARDSI